MKNEKENLKSMGERVVAAANKSYTKAQIITQDGHVLSTGEAWFEIPLVRGDYYPSDQSLPETFLKDATSMRLIAENIAYPLASLKWCSGGKLSPHLNFSFQVSN